MRIALSIASVSIVLILPAGGQQGTVDGPLLGYVFDSQSKGLKPVHGIPGNSRLGELVDVGVLFDDAVVARRQNYALGARSEGGDVFIVRLDGTPSAAPLGSQSAPGAFALSAGGSTAALYFPGTSLIQVFIGLPNAPSLVGQRDASTLPPGIGRTVSDDGQCVLALGADGSVTAVTQSGSRSLDKLGRISDAQFALGTHDAFLADITNHQVVAIADVAGAARRTIIAGPADGISQPTAVGLSIDESSLFVANYDAGSIARIGLRSPGINFTSCNCHPGLLQPMIGTALFRVTDGSEGPMLMFDAVTSSVTFIPAAGLSRRGGHNAIA